MQKNNYIKQKAKIELAKRSFWYYCKLMNPSFYKDSRLHLKKMCSLFQDFYEGEEDILIINMPPRHGKSYTATLFVEWTLGKNPEEKIMTASYNEQLSSRFSKTVREHISESKVDPSKVVYNDIFPNTKIKYGDSAMKCWSLEGQYASYLATSPSGTSTGFGASLLLIDDIIKNSEEAYNEDAKEKIWDWYTNTMLSRLEQGGKQIIVMTRWSTDDLAGRIIESCKRDRRKYIHINMKALQDNGTMLCEELCNHNKFRQISKDMATDIVAANYQQEPINLKGCLYTSFKTYDHIPIDSTGNCLFTKVASYCDTADKGSDFLCNIIYGEYNGEAYVLDVIYTNEPMEITEELVAKSLYENNVNVADIESNSGGRGFARSVERILKEKYHSNKTKIKPFHQSQNKQARILSNSTWVMEHIYLPNNWKDKYPEFYKALNKYQKTGKNAHDDAPDAITGVAEKINTNNNRLKSINYGFGI